MDFKKALHLIGVVGAVAAALAPLISDTVAHAIEANPKAGGLVILVALLSRLDLFAKTIKDALNKPLPPGPPTAVGLALFTMLSFPGCAWFQNGGGGTVINCAIEEISEVIRGEILSCLSSETWPRCLGDFSLETVACVLDETFSTDRLGVSPEQKARARQWLDDQNVKVVR